MTEHLGMGADGQNLLGFMCSIGVLSELVRIYILSVVPKCAGSCVAPGGARYGVSQAN